LALALPPLGFACSACVVLGALVAAGTSTRAGTGEPGATISMAFGPDGLALHRAKTWPAASRARSARRVQRSLLALLSLLVALLANGSAANADVPPPRDCPELPCSVIRNCSSAGVACKEGDRSCAEEARSRDLEVKCEQECDSGKQLIYCPPDTGRSDSKVVWLLLATAVAIAVAGGGLLWVILRKKSA
jgi:hypothetical protein